MKLNEFYFCIHSFGYFFCKESLTCTWSTCKNKILICFKKFDI